MDTKWNNLESTLLQVEENNLSTNSLPQGRILISLCFNGAPHLEFSWGDGSELMAFCGGKTQTFSGTLALRVKHNSTCKWMEFLKG